jgi:hypothetical protein
MGRTDATGHVTLAIDRNGAWLVRTARCFFPQNGQQDPSSGWRGGHWTDSGPFSAGTAFEFEAHGGFSMRRVFSPILLTLLVVAAPAAAQIQSRPTDAPIVTAENESWYVNGEAIQFAGDLYYPAGADVFFNGNTMVRSGHFNGVPLYSDTTLEPYSVVYVPIGRGMMQPYERPRQGSLAGTTASRTPSFPVRVTAAGGSLPQGAVAPTAPPATIGAIGAYTPESAVGTSGTTVPAAVGTGGLAAPAPRDIPTRNRLALTSIGRPTSNDGIWIRYLGEKWVSAGPAVPLTVEGFRIVGSNDGFPIFARNNSSEQVIYVPTRAGLVAPFRLKQ